VRAELSGVVASRGLALGRARIREPQALEVEEQRIEAGQVEAEVARLHDALAAAREELAALRSDLQGSVAPELGEFFDLHALLLDDPELIHGIDELIRQGRYSAVYALKLQRDRLAMVFDSIADPYFRSRREDLDQVVGRIYAQLHRRRNGQGDEGQAGEILVTDSVAPQELAKLAERGVLGVVTSGGSALSHSAILARSLHLPLLAAVHDLLGRVNDGDVLLLDAESGRVVVDPDAADIAEFHRQRRESERERKRLAKLRRAPTRTRDGVDIRLFANAESSDDVAEAFALGADGIGLYRTEFLFLQRPGVPDEDEQFRVYRDLVLGMGGRPVTIRTLDLGADKADATGLALAREPNPALGLRGVRLSLARRPLFAAQLRAILRAAAYGPVRILVPMVMARQELAEVRKLLRECRLSLFDDGLAFGDRVQLGGMIEVPAAAMALSSLRDAVDFLSIGTNDLVQYLLAVDRNNDAVAAMYSPLHPAVLRVLHEVLGSGRRWQLPVTVCGEIAGDPAYTRLLLALGLTQFSLHPSSLLEVRRAVRDCDFAALRRRASPLLRAPDREGIERVLARM
jgi:phosphoenolpyruvate-protein phosphotransferase (PTS system enzyme I)